MCGRPAHLSLACVVRVVWRGATVDGGQMEDLQGQMRRGVDVVNEFTERKDGMIVLGEADLQYIQEARTAGLRKCQRASCSEIEDESVQKFSCCSACSSPYCSRECQKADWKPCHKAMCEQLKSLRAGEPLDRHEACASVIRRLRLYICPFALCHYGKVGRGMVFLQAPSTLQEMYYLRPVDIFGGQLNRNVLVHFLTLGEFADAVMCDDFELGTLQPTLQAAVESYKVDEEIVILSKFRCGYLICVKVPLVPDFGICQALSVDYVGKDALQLNLDTT